MDPMWFYDEPEEREWHELRERLHDLEAQHLKTRTALRDAELALRTDTGNQVLRARVDELKKELAQLEKRIPWLSSETPIEVLLWGAPHG